MPTSETVKQLQAEAAAAFKKHNSPQTAAAARTASGQARTNGNAAAGMPRGSRG
ncbi:hypothetical protein [Streptomyces candidus]|uniref:Uncharacterized protein n=1 Tax=Streptomyces candidus TaxID=67283 RepID=A0A7X0HNS1_9ACTN|nr:hypothetical protein [Streptomyces candidus]MBB6439553.1 hypothetical protein [Streptomyces candidus]GHH54542.1 hypothetical protein GCM10018773_57660 [Streptomyces candidus]